MNLIEKLGLKKCKQIVDGAPDWARAYNTHRKYYTGASWFYGEVWLYDLRTAISDHEHNYIVGLEVLRDCDIPPNTIILER